MTTNDERADDMVAFAERVRATMAAGDPDDIAEVLSPRFRSWENTHGRWMTPAEIAAFHEQLAAAVTDFHFEDMRVRAIPGGYLEQHTKCMTGRDGTSYRVPSCLVVHVEDGRLVQAEEYLDASQLPPEGRQH